jgi:hypothetical protein
MQQSGINPPEGFEIRGLLANTLPLFVMSIMALLAVFRPDKDLFNLGDPIGRRLTVGFLGDRPLMESDIQHRHKQQQPPHRQFLNRSFVVVHWALAVDLELVPPTTDEMKIDAPPDRIAGVRRFIGPDGEITLLHGGLDGLPEIDQVADFFLVDFFNHRSHLDPGIVRPGIADHFKNGDAFSPLQLQFFLNLFINLADRNPEFFPELNGFLRRHLAVGARSCIGFTAPPCCREQNPAHKKSPSEGKGFFLERSVLLGHTLQRVRLIPQTAPAPMDPAFFHPTRNY